jgi:hypothetical protein
MFVWFTDGIALDHKAAHQAATGQDRFVVIVWSHPVKVYVLCTRKRIWYPQLIHTHSMLRTQIIAAHTASR